MWTMPAGNVALPTPTPLIFTWQEDFDASGEGLEDGEGVGSRQFEA